MNNLPVGSWELRINIEEFDIVEKSLLVTGDTHIGGVIFQLVENLTEIRNDWSDFALWWPDKNQWLNRTRMTLDQYGVQADALLYFTRIHKYVRIQLPDQQIVDINADFSTCVFKAVKSICKDLGIRHSEELSLIRTTPLPNLNQNRSKKSKQINDKNHPIKLSNSNLNNQFEELNYKENHSLSSSSSTLNNSSSSNANPDNGYNSHNFKPRYIRERSHSLSVDNKNECIRETPTSNDPLSLSISPILSTPEYLNKMTNKFKTIFDKSRINSRWLDSSKSLMEQCIKENDLIQLRFKYYAFYDLNTKYDSIRINQIYEQAKWSILSEEIDCTEQELINFAALQIQLQTKSLQVKPNDSIFPNQQQIINNNSNGLYDDVTDRNIDNHKNNKSRQFDAILDDNDDVDTALSKLEKSLDIIEISNKYDTHENDNHTEIKNNNLIINEENKYSSSNNLSIQEYNGQKNELSEELFLMKQQKYTFKKYKNYYFILDDTHYLSYFKSKEESKGKPIDKINLRGCELVPDVNIASRKFGINLKVPSSDGMTELSLRCPNEESYSQWMSACKLASKNKSISDQAYLNEVKSILNLLQIQQQKKSQLNNFKLSSSNNKSMLLLSTSSSALNVNASDNSHVQATNLLPLRMLKKHKLKQLNDRILESYSTISDLDLFESKWQYIKAWQALPAYGISYFTVKIKGSRHREELIGVTSSRLLRINPEGETIKSWRFNTMKSWSVNWDIKQFEIIFDDEQLVFLCMNCDSKILHEFIGGYIYLSLRNKDKYENLNEDMFFKLTEKR